MLSNEKIALNFIKYLQIFVHKVQILAKQTMLMVQEVQNKPM